MKDKETWINFKDISGLSDTKPYSKVNSQEEIIDEIIDYDFDDEDEYEQGNCEPIRVIENYISMEDFLDSKFAEDYWNNEGTIEASIVKDILDEISNRKANKDNFFENSFAIFSEVCPEKEEEIRNADPDYISKSYGGTSSIYWYKDGGVYRLSGHWGKGIRTCDWFLDHGCNIDDEMEHYGGISAKGDTGNMFITDDLRAAINAENVPQQINTYEELKELVEELENQYNIKILYGDNYDIDEFGFIDDGIVLSLDESPEEDGSDYYYVTGNKSVGGVLGFVKFEDIKFKDKLYEIVRKMEVK